MTAEVSALAHRHGLASSPYPQDATASFPNTPRAFKKRGTARLAEEAAIRRSGLFDTSWYLAQYPDVVAADIEPVKHYLNYGAAEGRDPSPFFDTKWYLSRYAQALANGDNPLVHFHLKGRQKGLLPHPVFNRTTLETIQKTRLFDERWYLAHHPDVAGQSQDPLTYHLLHGEAKGYDPSPFFDTDWYLSYYTDVAENRLSALLHYCHHGMEEGRAPSAFFDPYWYEAAHGVLKYGFQPLQHYVQYGFAEGRLARGLSGDHPVTSGLIQNQDAFITSSPTGLSIAVAIHMYYADLTDEFCYYLKNIPCKFTAIFCVTDETAIEIVGKAIEKFSIDCVPYFKICSNRGRNFGSLLVECSDIINEHDIFLHIHSKKSLRTGNEQSDWRNNILNGLLGSSHLVHAVLHRFANDPKAGIIYPSMSADSGEAYWFSSWLGAKHRAVELFQKLGVRDWQQRGLLDFPVGGMFWARTKALTSLLDHPWTYEDFDPEPSHHDGTFAHAIERSICQITHWHGYDHLEIDPYRGVFHRNWSEKLLGNYSSTDNVCQLMMDASEVISFDFYDTLACRLATTPDDIHNYIGFVLAHRQLIAQEEEFFTVRKAAEHHARQHCDKGDVDIDDIYAQFPAVCAWPQETIDIAKHLEFDIEVKVLRPRPDVIQLLQQASSRDKRVVLISDTYMPDGFFQKVLKNLRIDDKIDQIYLSSQSGLRKDRGDMWNHIKQVEASDRSFVHIGDNEESDTHMAVVNGLPAVPILNTTVLADLRGLRCDPEWLNRPTRWRDGLVLGPVIARLCAPAFLKDPSFRPLPVSTLDEIGYTVFGPAIFGFLTWIINHPATSQIKRLGFLAREGHFLHENYLLIQDLLGHEAQRLPPASYFHISRRLALGATQHDTINLKLLLDHAVFTGTISDFLLARLGYTIDPHSSFAESWVSTVDDREFIADVLTILEPDIRRSSQDLRTRLMAYVTAEQFDAPGLGLVDIGYSGTIQYALQRLLPHKLTGFYMATSQAATRVALEGGDIFGYFNSAGSHKESAVGNFSMIFEAFLTAPHGQVTDFSISDDGRVVPCFKQPGRSQENFENLGILNNGVKNYIKDLIETYGSEIVFTTYDARTCEIPFRALIDGTIRPPASFWSSLNVEDDFCGKGESQVKTIYSFPNGSKTA